MTATETYHASRPGYPPVARHVFTIATESPHWSRVYDVATCGPYRAISLKSCAARKLARVMMAAGEPDGPIEARGPDGKLRYTVRALHAFGKTTIGENPAIHTKRHVPDTRFAISGRSEALDDE